MTFQINDIVTLSPLGEKEIRTYAYDHGPGNPPLIKRKCYGWDLVGGIDTGVIQNIQKVADGYVAKVFWANIDETMYMSFRYLVSFINWETYYKQYLRIEK